MSANADVQPERPLMAAVNEAIDRLHRSLDVAESDFFCECGRVGCKERIMLSRVEYASLVDELRPVVVAAHAEREGAPRTGLREVHGQVHHLQETAASRVNIERAKGVLVRRHGMTPDDAFETLRSRARHQRRSLDEVCDQILAHAAALVAERASTPAPQSRRHDGAMSAVEGWPDP